MGKQLYTNNASTTLAANATSGATSLSLGSGAAFASPTGGDWQMATISDPATGLMEIIKITARSSNTVTVTRAQEGTTARAWASGTRIEARITKGMLERLAQSNADTTAALALGAGASVGGSDCVALGVGSVAGDPGDAYSGITAVGAGAEAAGSEATALGAYAGAAGDESVAIGPYAAANAARSVALGYEAAAEVEKSLAIKAVPCIQRDGATASTEDVLNFMGVPAAFSSCFCDLGNVPPWATATVHQEGDVVRPTTPNGYQYFLYLGGYASGGTNEITTGGAEPSFPASLYGNVSEAAGAGYWHAIDPSTGIVLNFPARSVFVPEEILFVCHNHANVSAAPFVSIGTEASPTLLVNNEQATQITGAMQVHRFTIANKVLTGGIQFKVETKATGTNSQFHGRFLVRGTFMNSQE